MSRELRRNDCRNGRKVYELCNSKRAQQLGVVTRPAGGSHFVAYGPDGEQFTDHYGETGPGLAGKIFKILLRWGLIMTLLTLAVIGVAQWLT